MNEDPLTSCPNLESCYGIEDLNILIPELIFLDEGLFSLVVRCLDAQFRRLRMDGEASRFVDFATLGAGDKAECQRCPRDGL